MSNELQNDDITLPGGLGTVSVGNKVSDITKKETRNDGSTTLTLTPHQFYLQYWGITEDADFEVIEPKQIENNAKPETY